MQHIETEDPNKPPNHTNKHSSQQTEADSSDFAADKSESHSPEKREKKKKRKKREIQLANAAEAVASDDLTATEVVEEARSSSKSSDKKSKKRNKECHVAAVGENAAAETSGTRNSDSSDDKKKTREVEITKDTEAATLTANTKNGVEEAPSVTKSSDKKSKKRDREKGVAAGGERCTANVSESGKEHVSYVKDVSATMSGDKKRNKENNVSAGGENGNAEMKETGKDGDSDDSTTSKQMSKKNGKKGKDVVSGGTGHSVGNGAAEMAGDGKEGDSVDSAPSKQRPRRLSSSKPTKKVSFSGEVEVFDDKEKSSSLEENDNALVQGKRFTPEEDDLIKEAVMKYIQGLHYLGGLIDPYIFEPTFCLRDLRLVNGSLTNTRPFGGNWSQEEYQSLFDLVNSDLAMKAFVEKKTMHGMLKDNISWEAISTKLSTRAHHTCCMKWYKQLTSPLVSQGLWMDTDDYRLLDALQKVDACCVEDVDWDNLIKYRPGDICRKRWEQMVRHIGGHKEKFFIEQLDVLTKRYCPQMLQYRKDEGCSNATPPHASVTSLHKKTAQDEQAEVPRTCSDVK